MTDLQIIELIKRGVHSKALNKLYTNYPSFKKSLMRLGGTKQDAEDIFQQGLLILLEKVMEDGFTLTCSINTFLYSICRNITYEYFRHKEISVQLDISKEVIEYELNIETYVEDHFKFKALDKILTEIGMKCLELLNMFYYKGFSMIEIARLLGFKSETSAKTQKYKCIERARELAKDYIIEPEIRMI